MECIFCHIPMKEFNASAVCTECGYKVLVHKTDEGLEITMKHNFTIDIPPKEETK